MSRHPSARKKPARRSIADGVMTKFSRGVERSCVRHNVRSLVLPPMRSIALGAERTQQAQQRAIVGGEEIIRRDTTVGGSLATSQEGKISN
jgi:hypothetical protein